MSNHATIVRTDQATKPHRLTPTMKRRLRHDAEAAIERLISLLDQLDGDPDFEPELSQSTGAYAYENQALSWALPAVEADDSDDEPNADDQDNTWHTTPFAIDQRGTGWL